MILSFSLRSLAVDYYVTGKVTDISGKPVPGASIFMNTGSFRYSAKSSAEGDYKLKISGVYGNILGPLEQGTPYPNPFGNSVNIPFMLSRTGDINFAVYSMSGQKITDMFFAAIDSGSYQIVWDGRNASGVPVRQGFYVYAITFMGQTWSGRLVKVAGSSFYSSASAIEQVMSPVPVIPSSGNVKVPVITTVSSANYYQVKLTDIVISRDTIMDFILQEKDPLPFKTAGNYIAVKKVSGYRSLILKGINLGSSLPGTFPGEIAYSISGDLYEKWIRRIVDAGFNCIRIYTLHPPVFYEKLANYNNRHPDDPLFLFQGIWLDEIEDPSISSEYDLIQRIPSFESSIREVIDCVHGKRNISFRPGRAYGNYSTDISPWIAGFILGREISSQEVDSTNSFHYSLNAYTGSNFSISGASASEVFSTHMLDEAVIYEHEEYDSRRPVSFSSWPTLDPLNHPTEIHTDEDKAQIDLYKITGKNTNAGIFATYHAYPYYPNFISEQPSYRSFADNEGSNSYLGYITDLKNHYRDIPLVIGEFGVPSSWGSAHQSFSGMNHGSYSEKQQGEKNIRMMHNIIDADCAGGFMFSWMDEWFKQTWIVAYLEAFGFNSGDVTIPTRQLWQNIVSPEQNFGLIGFEQKEVLPFLSYLTDKPSGPVTKIEATNDNGFFLLKIELMQSLAITDTIMVAFDTYSSSTGESRLPNGKQLANRAEFLFSMSAGNDTALYYVTEAYDMNGLTPRFNLSDPARQKYKSIISDGAPWKLMQWINDGFEFTKYDLGKLPVEKSSDFSQGFRTAAAWTGNKIKLRIPWTLLYFYDPTQMSVIDGAVTNDGGASWEIQTRQSDGIALSVYCKGEITSTLQRYNWDKWLVVPSFTDREKESLHVVEASLALFPDFAD